MVDEFLKEDNRAEDILLGSLGIGEEAKILTLERTEDGYKGTAQWKDGEIFPFESEDPLDELQEWAVGVILKRK